jgi:hypothetical protein
VIAVTAVMNSIIAPEMDVRVEVLNLTRAVRIERRRMNRLGIESVGSATTGPNGRNRWLPLFAMRCRGQVTEQRHHTHDAIRGIPRQRGASHVLCRSHRSFASEMMIGAPLDELFNFTLHLLHIYTIPRLQLLWAHARRVPFLLCVQVNAL